MIDNRTIAVCDILGFKERIFREDLNSLSGKYEKAIRYANALNKPFATEENKISKLFPQHEEGKPWCEINIFSDAIILISNTNSEEDTLKLMIYIWRLSQTFMSFGLPFRGGIVHNEIYFNKQEGIILGKALTLACELEQAQEWIGVSVDESILINFPALKNKLEDKSSILGHIFPKYLVPLKGGTTKDLHVVSWRFNLIVQNGTRSLFDTRSGGHSAIRKVKNTLTFATFFKNNFSLLFEPSSTPLELGIFYKGDKGPPFAHGDNL